MIKEKKDEEENHMITEELELGPLWLSTCTCT